MLEVVICEDDFYFADRLRELAETYLQEKKLEATLTVSQDGESLLQAGAMPDLILMDIKLPGKSGMEIMEQLRQRGSTSQVIFITAYPEHVFHAFDLEAVHYLLKPVNAQRLYPVMDKAVKRALSRKEPCLLLAAGTEVRKLPLKEVLYCEVFGHQVLIHTATGNASFPGSLDSLEERLDSRFFRCHRSYLVNMDYVVGKEAGAAKLAGGDTVLIARRRETEFTKRLLDSCGEGVRGWS